MNTQITQDDTALLTGFTTWLEVKAYRPRSIIEMKRGIRNYLNFTTARGIPVSTTGIRDAEGYREYLRLLTTDAGKQRYSPKTINREIAFLRLFYRYLIAVGMAARNPFLAIEKMKESDTLPKTILSIDEMGRLLAGISVRTRNDFLFRLIIELLYATGARVSEIEHLRAEDVDPGHGSISIRENKERSARVASLTDYSRELLALYLTYTKIPQKTSLFARGQERTLNRWLNDRLKRLTHRLDLPRITCHGIRHSIATHLLKSGADIREVQEFLGHRDITSTEIYTRIYPDDLKKMVQERHPRERGRGEETGNEA